MKNRAAEIHAELKHPVIDGDGHWMEPIPVFLEYLSEVAGAKSVDQMRALWRRNQAWYRSTWPERQHHRLRRTIWWGVTSNTLDKATALLPALLNERLPELGQRGAEERSVPLQPRLSDRLMVAGHGAGV